MVDNLPDDIQKMLSEAIALNILCSCDDEEPFVMLRFPDGENISLDDEKELEIYLEAILKGADMMTWFGDDTAFDSKT